MHLLTKVALSCWALAGIIATFGAAAYGGGAAAVVILTGWLCLTALGCPLAALD